jgi:hypothetical protein
MAVTLTGDKSRHRRLGVHEQPIHEGALENSEELIGTLGIEAHCILAGRERRD